MGNVCQVCEVNGFNYNVLDKISLKQQGRSEIILIKDPDKQSLSVLLSELIKTFDLNPEDFDSNGDWNYSENNNSEFQKFKMKTEQRGGFPYIKPANCIRLGLNIIDKYDNGDNTWFEAYHDDQWAICYHGLDTSLKVQEQSVLKIIIRSRLMKAGKRNLYAGCQCQSHSQCQIPYQGIYLAPDPQVSLRFSEQRPFSNNKLYSVSIQCRVNPKSIHIVSSANNTNDKYWVVENPKYIRPCAIIIRQCKYFVG